jgi:hypothetical protein
MHAPIDHLIDLAYHDSQFGNLKKYPQFGHYIPDNLT